MEQRQARIWFISDTHFNHANIINICQRPFANVDEMNKALIANWNACIQKKDTVWFLGDFAYAREYRQAEPFAAALNGKKYFVSGNHDKWGILQELKANRLIEDCFFKIAEMKLDGIPITMTHYPLIEWNQCFWNGLQLYGHVHSSYGQGLIDNIMQITAHKSRHYMNVGVDLNNYQPISWDFIRQQEEAKGNVQREQDIFHNGSVFCESD